MSNQLNRMPVGIYEKALPARVPATFRQGGARSARTGDVPGASGLDEPPWEEILLTAAEAGYDFVEMSIDESEMRLARLRWSAAQRSELRRAIANTGVPIRTMCLSGHRKASLGSASPETRAQALEILRGAIDLAADIGLAIVQVMGYDVFYEPAYSGTEARFLEGLQRGVQWAGAAGIMLGLENCDLEFADSIDKALRIVAALNSPWFQLYPDMGNLAAAGYDPAEQLRQAAGHLVAVHVKDTKPGLVRGVPFGQGLVPFAQVFKTLAEINFWGPITVEMWAAMDDSGDPLAAAVAARRLVADLVAQAWPDPSEYSEPRHTQADQ